MLLWSEMAHLLIGIQVCDASWRTWASIARSDSIELSSDSLVATPASFLWDGFFSMFSWRCSQSKTIWNESERNWLFLINREQSKINHNFVFIVHFVLFVCGFVVFCLLFVCLFVFCFFLTIKGPFLPLVETECTTQKKL